MKTFIIFITTAALMTAALTAEAKRVPSTTADMPAMIALPASQEHCEITRTIRAGSRGEDVRALQNYLRDQGILKTNPSGYFGTTTQQAVRQWQRQNGIQASGIFGAASRGYIGKSCAGRDVSVTRRIGNDTFSVNPGKGGAPLTVQFRAVTTDATGMEVQFGDGQSAAFSICAESYPLQCSLSHTYTTVGTYEAKFVKRQGRAINTITSVMVVVTNETPAQVQTPPSSSDTGMGGLPTYQGGYNPQGNEPQKPTPPKACTREYNPVCARPSGCDNHCTSGTVCTAMCKLFNPKVYSNKCMAEADGARYLHDGACTSASNSMF